MAVTATPTPFLVNVYNFFRGFSCFMSLTARRVCEAAGFYYTNNSTQFTCAFTDKLENNMSWQLPKIPFSESTWKTDVNISAWLCKILEKIRLSVWSMSRLSSSLPLVNILTPMRARAAKLGWNAMVRSLLFYTPQNVSVNLCHKHFISVVCNFLIITISPFFFRINSFNNASQLPLSFL